ncbi:MAG TPA: isoprenylcysteine carboxylmethyltransferase family protein [Rubrobacter sp.]|nr:isoprenylcysteine carboxylmethyltransferase family protein [Rubrobacter sp.]
MGDDGRNDADNPGVVAPPPFIYAGALVLGLIANRRLRVGFLPRRLRRTLGPSLIFCGFLVGLSGFREVRRAGSSVDPYKPVTAIATGGPYRFTRNPMYLGFTLMYLGISALANAFLPVLLLPGILQLMRRGVIEREERYLERKFGEEYRQYKESVRRWI